MKSNVIAIILALILIVSSSCFAAKEPNAPNRPLVLIVPITLTVDGKDSPSDPDVIAAVSKLMAESGKVDTLIFDPDLPTVTRAIFEGKLKSEAIRKVSDASRAMEIGRALNVGYTLICRGTVVGNQVDVALELLKIPSGGRWVATSGSLIAEGMGSIADINRKNAILTAASSAVSQIAIMAFGGAVAQPADKPPEYVPVVAVPKISEPKPRNIQAEYEQHVKQADEYIQKNDLINGIHELREAINLNPSNSGSRVKLAELYWKLGMVDEAIDECRRGLLFNKDDASLITALVQYYITTGNLEEAAAECQKILQLDPQNVKVRLSLGDIYWNQGKIDEAAKTYEEAAELNQKDAAPHEKLYKLYAAKRMYTEALKHLVKAKEVALGDNPTAAERHGVLAQVLEERFNALLEKLKVASEDYSRQKLSREDYYQECKDADAEAEGLATFISSQNSSDNLKEVLPRAVLATSLLAQATGSLVLYLETEKKQYMEQASILQDEAKAELAAFLSAIRQR